MPAISDRPAKRAKLLSDDESSQESGEDTGVPLTNGDHAALKVNSEYAKRFEHNKKREDLHRLEEKYKREGVLSDSDSTSEDEDDDGDLATVELDGDIEATLKALKSKDPRIYDKQTSFFRPVEEGVESAEKKEKPMRLADYHRQNLMNGEREEDDAPKTYSQEQNALRKDLVNQMHAAAKDDEVSENDGDGDFMVKKTKAAHDDVQIHPDRRKVVKELKVDEADKDPETYLSNYMAARAWVPDDTSRFAHLDSDDSEEEQRAEDFEAAYNMRFEDPEVANAKLMSYGRDTAKYSVRREEKTGRQKQREREKDAVEAAKRERREERNRYRNLKVEEMERKVAQIKEAAGLGAGDVVDVEEWKNVLEGDFDDDQWETEMQRRFGDQYYADQDGDAGSDDDDEKKTSRSKVKKPQWNKDIDINDLVPDFDEDTEERPQFTLTDDEEGDGANDPDTVMADNVDAPLGDSEPITTGKAPKAKSRNQLAAESRSAARRQRAQIESLVDSTLDPAPLNATSSGPTLFRYRETSPSSFGLSARDILFADDMQLNTFAGLKKTHAFRDEAKKAKDRKKLGKKKRLREWRREVFGREEGFGGTFADYVKGKTGEGQEEDGYSGRRREYGGEASRKDKKNNVEHRAKAGVEHAAPQSIDKPVVEPPAAESAVAGEGGTKRKRKRKHKGQKTADGQIAA